MQRIQMALQEMLQAKQQHRAREQQKRGQRLQVPVWLQVCSV